MFCLFRRANSPRTGRGGAAAPRRRAHSELRRLPQASARATRALPRLINLGRANAALRRCAVGHVAKPRDVGVEACNSPLPDLESSHLRLWRRRSGAAASF